MCTLSSRPEKTVGGATVGDPAASRSFNRTVQFLGLILQCREAAIVSTAEKKRGLAIGGAMHHLDRTCAYRISVYTSAIYSTSR